MDWKFQGPSSDLGLLVTSISELGEVVYRRLQQDSLAYLLRNGQRSKSRPGIKSGVDGYQLLEFRQVM